MEIRMGSQQGTKVGNVNSVLAEIQRRLKAEPQKWLKALKANPGDFVNLEQEVHRDFARMADEVVAGLLAEATAPAAFADAAQKK